MLLASRTSRPDAVNVVSVVAVVGMVWVVGTVWVGGWYLNVDPLAVKNLQTRIKVEACSKEFDGATSIQSTTKIKARCKWFLYFDVNIFKVSQCEQFSIVGLRSEHGDGNSNV